MVKRSDFQAAFFNLSINYLLPISTNGNKQNR